MEKMNQVSVSEFFAKSKEEMYDMAVEMVEKYNRLVDICNDSAERMAELIERHVKKVDELEKEVNKWQDLAKMNRDTICDQYGVCEEFKNKIVELEEENEKLKVDLMHEREKNEKLAKDHAELENDIRKYTTEIKTLEEKVKHQRENLDGINKTLEIKIKENERLIIVRNNLNKEIEAHESENARLSEKIMKLHGTITELSHEIDNYKSWNTSLHKDIKELKKNKEDDHGKSGFKRYIEHLIEEEERAVPERFKERLNQEITEIFTKEEETEVKGVGRTSSGRYPWGAKVNDIPCGEDAIE